MNVSIRTQQRDRPASALVAGAAEQAATARAAGSQWFPRHGRLPLNAASQYELDFAKGEPPPVEGSWSVTMSDAESYIGVNPLNRCATVGRHTLTYDADGSLDCTDGAGERTPAVATPAFREPHARWSGVRRYRCGTTPKRTSAFQCAMPGCQYRIAA